MFNVGGAEVLVIALVALIVLGPERLPAAIRQVGQVVGQLRRMSAGFQTDLRSAIAQAEREATRAAEARTTPPVPGADTPSPADEGSNSPGDTSAPPDGDPTP